MSKTLSRDRIVMSGSIRELDRRDSFWVYGRYASYATRDSRRHETRVRSDEFFFYAVEN